MTWTFDDGSSNRDRVRRLIGDTDTTDQLVTDETITDELTQSGNDIKQAASQILYGLASKYARKAVSKSAGKYSEDMKAVADNFRKMADAIKQSAVEPWDDVAEQTFDDRTEKQYIEKDSVRNS